MKTNTLPVPKVPVELRDLRTSEVLAVVQVPAKYAGTWIAQYNSLSDLAGRYAVQVEGGDAR